MGPSGVSRRVLVSQVDWEDEEEEEDDGGLGRDTSNFFPASVA